MVKILGFPSSVIAAKAYVRTKQLSIFFYPRKNVAGSISSVKKYLC